MYKAAMEYRFNEDGFEKACQLWRQMIYAKALSHKGLIQMLFLTNRPTALAIGVWDNQTNAMHFMETGIFKEFVGAAKDFMTADPQPGKWKVIASYPGEE